MKKLTEKHPLAQKVSQLEELAANLNITLTWDRFGRARFEDTETGTVAFYCDLEGGPDSRNNPTSFPSGLETKLILAENE